NEPPAIPEKTAQKRARPPRRAGFFGASISFLCLMGIAALFRLAYLDKRPMHADEAVQAFIFSDLLEHGKYRYDPAHYHGPLPHFINLPLMRALGIHKLDTLQPWQFRLQPALAGLLLVLLCAAASGKVASETWQVESDEWLVAGRETTALAGVFRPSALSLQPSFIVAAMLAVWSPLLAYFSRMAIHETLLACLALAVPLASARFLATRRLRWLLAAGAALGGLHATKETWGVIAFSWAAAALATGPAGAWRLLRETGAARLALAAAVALGVSFLFYSNFGRHPRGFADAWLSLFQYKTGAGHEAPWSYYLTDILAFRSAGGGYYGEGAILIFAAIGAVFRMRNAECGMRNEEQDRPSVFSCGAAAPNSAFRTPHSAFVSPRSALPSFLALSAVAQIVVYSIIGYKTPWLMLVPVACLVPLAGRGFVWMCGCLPRERRAAAPGQSDEPARPGKSPVATIWRQVIGSLAAFLILFLGVFPQLHDVRHARATDPALPLVYAPTLPEADAALRKAVASLKPGELAAVIGDDYWPLPWYFRARRDDTGYYGESEAPGDLGQFALVVRCGFALPSGMRPGDKLVELRPGYYARISKQPAP
ncbi:MAG: hypothetical protein LBM92_01190, partial [Opitutaceae bacterium]|nr:hypothetical protein [Opitutaceae bacterium]